MGRCFQFGVSACAVGAEDPAHVGGVLLAGVEVDVVGHLERQVHRHRRQRQQVRLDRVAVGGVAEHLDEPPAGRGPGVRAARQEVVEARLGPAGAGLHAGVLGGEARVQHLVADADADPAQVRVVGGEHAVRQRGQAERVVCGQVEPAGAHAVSLIRPSVDRSCTGSVTPQQPYAVKKARTTLASACAHAGEDVHQWRRVPLLQQGLQLGHLRGVGQRPAGGAEDVDEPVLVARRRRWCARRRGAGRR